MLKNYEVSWEAEAPAMGVGKEGKQGGPLGDEASYGMWRTFLRFKVGEGQWETAWRQINRARPQISERARAG